MIERRLTRFDFMLFSNISEDDLIINSEFRKGGILYYDVSSLNRGIRCTNCGTYHTSVKEYITKKITHFIYLSDPCVIIFHHRRFICPKCKKTHMDVNPFGEEKQKVSDKTIENILSLLKRYNVPFRQAAEMANVSVTEVMKIFDRYCQMKRNTFTQVMCFDEIYFSRKRKKKYVLVIINFFNRAIIDVLKDRDKTTIASYLRRIDRKERERVLYVCIDMNDNYREVLRRYFPNAFIVADSFHVVKHIAKAMDEVRKKVMRRFEADPKGDEYYLLKYRDELLYRKDDLSAKMRYNHHFRIEMSEFELLEKMKHIDPELNKAYELYQEYVRFNNTRYSDPVECMNDLNEVINDYRISDIIQFQKAAVTLKQWSSEIVNSFAEYRGKRVSNGPMEGRNSLAKKILRIANGYSNFSRFRNRIIYSLNKFATHSFKRETE